MAIYDVSQFATKEYGPETEALPVVSYRVDPVVAEPLSYTIMSLTWNSPVGDWTGLRVLKSYYGYAVDETDGEILLDTSSPSQSLIDNAVRPGAWHYYSIFVQISGAWQYAGGAGALMVQDHGYGKRLFNSLPQYHQSLGNDGQDSPVENTALQKFLNVLGWGLDYSKTNLDSLQHLNDPARNSLSDLAQLSDELGIIYEASAPIRLFRKRVSNAAVLGRERGTLEQLQSLITLTTSYSVVLSMSPNIMVTDDAASFTHPIFPPYSPDNSYLSTERVSFNNFAYQCNPGGAYGPAQAPSGAATTNTWWTNLSSTVDPTLVDADGAVYGWEPTHYSGTADPSLTLALGVQNFQDSTDLTASAIRVLNTTGATADLGASSIAKRLGESTIDSEQVFRFGTPIPIPFTWNPTDTYPQGTLVNYDGMIYRAFRQVTGFTPGGTFTDTFTDIFGGIVDNAYWEIISPFDRMNLGFSLYAKGGVGFEIPAYPVIKFFDELGVLVTTLDTEKEAASGSIFDSFSNRNGLLVARTLDSGSLSWTVQSGSWEVTDMDGGIAWPLSAGLITIPGTADGNVAATFDTAAVGTNSQFVVFRGASPTSFLFATRTGLYSSLGGVSTLIGTYSTPFSDNDRITVNFVGSAISVSRNGTSVLSASSGVNQTSVLHGLGVGVV